MTVTTFPDRWTRRPYTADDVQLQGFVDNACTTWLPNGNAFTSLSDVEAGRLIKQLVGEQVEIANNS